MLGAVKKISVGICGLRVLVYFLKAEESFFIRRLAEVYQIFISSFLHFFTFYHYRHLLMPFANSFDPKQARHNVEPDLHSKLLNTLLVILIEVFFNLKNEQTKRKHAKLPSIQRVNALRYMSKATIVPTKSDSDVILC